MCRQSHGPTLACQSRCAQGTVPGPVFFTIMINDISPTSQHTLMTKYADDITGSIPAGPNVNDNASEEVENVKDWAEESLIKLNLSKTKELVMLEASRSDFSGQSYQLG